MANYPSFDLNEPFTINNPELAAAWEGLSSKEQSDALNTMWRNSAINDTYEPGSIFKIITSVAGLEEGVVTPESTFYCRGFHVAGDRQIKCWRYPRTHGAETFAEGVQSGWVRKPFWIMWKNLASGKKQALTWQGKLRESSMN